MIEKSCIGCKKIFQVKPYRKDSALYCSRSCSNESRRVHAKCDQCSDPISYKRSHFEKLQNTFCSRACQGKWNSKNRVGANANGFRHGNSFTYDKIICKVCGQTFSQLRKYLLKGFGFICSKGCRSLNSSKLRGEKSPAYKQRLEVSCELCGKTKSLIPSFAKAFRFCSKECRAEWQSTRMTGSNHPLWNGGISEFRSRLSVSREYKAWRLAVFVRDGFCCQHCGDRRGHNLNAHHIEYVSECPERIFDVSNGLTLCESCHRDVHRKRPAVRGTGKLSEELTLAELHFD